MKKAVVTTFPLDMYSVYAREMLVSFDKHWPADIPIFIALDCVNQEHYNAIQTDLNQRLVSGREFFISNEFSKEQREFLARNKDTGEDYRLHVCKFSHKVFAVLGAASHARQEQIDCIIWLDADVVSHAPVTHAILEQELLPLEGQAVSFLGRDEAPHSECGFMAFVGEAGFELIEAMADYYVTDKVLSLQGWTDCDVFDDARKGLPARNLSNGLPGWHVWPQSALGKYTQHNKGNRKFTTLSRQTQGLQPIDADNLQIKTRNCLPHDLIRQNVQQNLLQIRQWVQYVRPHDEDVVICSAGPSLSYGDIKRWADRGVKIITVKHAIDRLKAWGIKPWACVLLDPRPHVESFVKAPDKDVIYFVASMCDPSVVRTLLENKCTVIGYHAFVGANEQSVLNAGELMVSGGSATATRCLGLLNECLGFKTFHCYGYDLCHFTKPDMNERLPDGNSKYIEVNLASKVWGNKTETRTFWTEGQLLAQAKELADLYKTNNSLTIKLYGFGIAPWQQACWKQYKAWLESHELAISRAKQASPSLEEWQHGISRRII